MVSVLAQLTGGGGPGGGMRSGIVVGLGWKKKNIDVRIYQDNNIKSATIDILENNIIEYILNC